jgi:predicted nucleic acid-binding protein
MPGFAYLDASALVKLAVYEPETPALERAVLDRDALFTSEVGAIELHRALGRTGQASAQDQADAVLDAVFLADLTPAVRSQAGRLAPRSLRTLDAIHVATAANLSLPGLDFITYDDRQAAAARAHGLRVLQPGKIETQPEDGGRSSV